MTLLDKIETSEGNVIVITKTRYLWFIPLPRTSVMPWHTKELVESGVQFHWNTTEPDDLQFVHDMLLQTLREGISLTDPRGIANLGRQLMRVGPDVPFIPPDSPLPDSLKAISKFVKRAI